MNNKIAKGKKGKLVSKNIIPKKVRKGLIAVAVGASLVLTSMPTGIINNSLVVEAKKKNTKPKIKFKGKLKNNKKLTISEGDRILVKAIAKDKEDGNLTKKIKYNISAPANGIYQKEGKYIKFINDGKYKITVSVKDKKKAKTSLTRTIIVKDKKDENSDILTIAETPTPAPIQTPEPVVSTSPVPTNTPASTLAPTETPKETQQPVSSESPIPSTTPTDYSKYNFKEIMIGDKKYNATNDSKFEDIVIPCSMHSDKIRITVENDYSFWFDIDNGMIESLEFLKYLGKIAAYDENGNDISNNIIISYSSLNGAYPGAGFIIYLYVEDSYGNAVKKEITLYPFRKDPGQTYNENTFSSYGFELINLESLLYGRRENTKNRILKIE